MRLFIGIDLPSELKEKLSEFQSDLKQSGIQGSWRPVENLHITLEFLGEINTQYLSQITDTMAKVANNHKPFTLSLGGLGAFPSFKRPRVLWTAVGESLKELEQLRDELHFELKEKEFILDDRPFKPHITLASRPQIYNIDLSKFKSKYIGKFTVSEFVLFESKLGRGKPIYIDLFKVGLN